MSRFFKEIFVFAGPNGSGKSTVIKAFLESGACPDEYICPDNLVPVDKKEDPAAYMEAMILAEEQRMENLNCGKSFTFETVLSTESKIDFLKKAKEKGFRITAIYITTCNPRINYERVTIRKKQGGHGVPKDKVYSRYDKSMKLMADVIDLADEAEVYDNSFSYPIQVFEKNEYAEVILLNREQRNRWVDEFITKPLMKKMVLIHEDLTCAETEAARNRD
ncbi:hypothetical protein MmiHf6_04820 [Methanimicrococcus hongohii]|uniref:Zeta toxin domain-containing protein n=1 Tax=Methanimicrococcus hongohii TaxID=3028295 RepID=A0AA96V1A5_9EURY|nr:zeta toxin family protein [Methanimicrococcus sp. Hf6]WNY23178.1 hypothetical protein MmiHf6_04820 [Methanimicrococcus sp. Hf6]